QLHRGLARRQRRRVRAVHETLSARRLTGLRTYERGWSAASFRAGDCTAAAAAARRIAARSRRSVARCRTSERPKQVLEVHRTVEEREANEQRFDQQLLLAAFSEPRLQLANRLQHAQQVSGS